jgi:hypothetical protein
MNYQSMRDPAILIVALHEQTAALNRLAEVLATPTTRTATLQLPSGPASMTVHESRPGRAGPFPSRARRADIPRSDHLAALIEQLEAAAERGRARERAQAQATKGTPQ